MSVSGEEGGGRNDPAAQRPAGRDAAPGDIAAEHVCEIRRRMEDQLLRDLHADKSNGKWGTGIFCIHTKRGVRYLSMIRDLCGKSSAAHKTGTEQTENPVLGRIRLAVKQEKKKAAAESRLHSGQGARYAASQHILSRLKHTALRRLCRGGNPYDNAAAEDSSSLFKRERIYRRKAAALSPVSRSTAILTSAIMGASGRRPERRRLRDTSPPESQQFLPGRFLSCPHDLGQFQGVRSPLTLFPLFLQNLYLTN